MCLILIAHDCHSEYRQVVAGNRDEFLNRPATPAGRWPDDERIVAGRDLQAGGTWMGVRGDERWAAVTNVRDFSEPQRPDAPSRGKLVGDFLAGEASPAVFLRDLAGRADLYNGFNLLLSAGGELYWYSNRSSGGPRRLSPGLYGVSNAGLDTPWPKVERGKRALAKLLRDSELGDEALFRILADRHVPPEAELPNTGAGREMERALAPAFIVGDEYGTRNSTLLLLRRGGGGRLAERTFGPGGKRRGQVEIPL